MPASPSGSTEITSCAEPGSTWGGSGTLTVVAVLVSPAETRATRGRAGTAGAMTYTALAILFLLICVGLGGLRMRDTGATRVAAGLAVAMVAAQFYILALR